MDSDKIAKIINSYNGDDIPESLREVCIDYFCNNSDDSSSESESTDRISDVLATALEDQQPTTDNEDQITEINLSEIPIVFEGDEYDFDDPGLGNPVEEVEDFDLPDIPVIGSENEVNAEFVPVWEPIEYEERMIEDDATIRAFKVEGCCSKKCCDKFTVLLQTISDGPKTSSTVSSADPLDDFPNIINPTGLTYKRKLYLYEKIRPFCPKEHQDLLCPHPGPPSREDGNKSSSKPSSPGNNKTPSQKRMKLPAILKSKGKKVKKN